MRQQTFQFRKNVLLFLCHNDKQLIKLFSVKFHFLFVYIFGELLTTKPILTISKSVLRRMDYCTYDPKTENFKDSSIVMSRSKALLSSQNSNGRIHYILWPFIFGVNLYDFLGLCHLVPTHSLHLSRPFMMSTSSFQIFQKTPARTFELPMISN